ncbi:hypothetical protein RIF29_41403 [Crotalaria pallida]|uniref:Secreted protein n=1 Tax=Crotalaria pallida TaxID=3830 RepID=A0AAN9E5C5_CROPI
MLVRLMMLGIAVFLILSPMPSRTSTFLHQLNILTQVARDTVQRFCNILTLMQCFEAGSKDDDAFSHAVFVFLWLVHFWCQCTPREKPIGIVFLCQLKL